MSGREAERGRETNGIRDSRCSTYNIISQTNICSLLRQLCHYGNVLHREQRGVRVCVCVCVCERARACMCVRGISKTFHYFRGNGERHCTSV